jgi:hypothetical protein
MSRFWVATLAVIFLLGCSPENPTASDLEMLQSFHKQVWAKSNELDSAATEYRARSSDALKSGDRLALYQAASRMDGIAQSVSSEIMAWRVPTFQNQTVQARANDALEQLKQRALMIETGASAVAQMADTGDVRPSAITVV